MKRHSHFSKAVLNFASLAHVQILGGRMKRKVAPYLIEIVAINWQNSRASLI